MLTLLVWLFSLLLIAILVFVTSAWREKNFSLEARNKLNTDYYLQQLNEFQGDDKRSSSPQQQALLIELDQRLLTDIPNENIQKRPTAPRLSLIPGIIILLLAPPILYLQVTGAGQWLRWQEITAIYPTLRERLLNPEEKNLTTNELIEFSIGLRNALVLHPENGDDWGMLARLTMALNQPEDSRLAFEQALQKQPNNKAIKVDYATLLVRSPIPDDNQQGIIYLKKLLAEYPKESRIINLVAVNFYNLKQYAQAIYYWQKLLALYPKDSANSNEILKAITKARSESGLLLKPLRLDIAFDQQGMVQLTEDERLYIFVTDGISEKVVATKQLPIGHFPLQVTLDDSDSLQETRLLSTIGRIQVTVKIAKSSTKLSEPVTWFGESKVVQFTGQQLLKLKIVKH